MGEQDERRATRVRRLDLILNARVSKREIDIPDSE
jgi:hypothetical protein